MGKVAKQKIYAVAIGRKPGIYLSWTECETQVKGFKGAKFKSFTSQPEAQSFIAQGGSSLSQSAATSASKSLPSTSAIASTGPSGKSTTKKSKFYAVAFGHKQGVYGTWDECSQMVKGFSRPVFKSFFSKDDAEAFITKYNIDQSNMIHAPGQEGGQDTPRGVPSRSLSIVLYFDGGARGNPGIAGAGAFLVITRKNESLSAPQMKNEQSSSKSAMRIRHFCGNMATNNVAEYTGLREGLIQAKGIVEQFIQGKEQQSKNGRVPKTEKEGIGNWWSVDIKIRGDSNLVMNQLSGYVACHNEALRKLRNECLELMQNIRSFGTKNTDDGGAKCELESCHDIYVRVTHEHVYRGDNKAADGLANEAMDKKESWVTSSVESQEGVDDDEPVYAEV